MADAIGCTVARRAGDEPEAWLLENGLIQVTVLAGKGGDIVSFVDAATDVDVLWKTPWASGAMAAPERGDSRATWLNACLGGWQLLCPNAGPACTLDGTEHPFHGEASMGRWRVERASADAEHAGLVLGTQLTSAPFQLTRSYSLSAGSRVLKVSSTLRNDGTHDQHFMWVEHPGFGEPLLGEGARIECGARTIRRDDDSGDPGEWPLLSEPGGVVDLSLPAQSAGRASVVYLSDFTSGWYAISNDKLGLGAGLSWPLSRLPYAWMWHEFGGTEGFPWYGAARTLAIEPASSVPAGGLAAAVAAGQALLLRPRETWTIDICATLFEPRGRVIGIDGDGRVRMEDGR